MTGRIRVLHIVPALFGLNDGIIGGAERYALELAHHMATTVPTTLISFGVKERNETLGSLNIRVIGNTKYVRGQRTNPVITRRLLTELRKADVIHCHQQHILASSTAALYCRCTGRRVFVTDLGGGGWDISGYISTDSWFHGHLHISEYSRKIFGQAKSRNAHVIFGGVDVDKFSPEPTVRRDGTVLFVGRLLPHKGIDDLINAVPEEIPLEIIGQPYDPEFFRDLQKLAAGKRVTFRHNCDDAALVKAYRKALCVVLPSVYKTMYGHMTKVPELLGQTLLEGMACGAPAICTDVASMPEIVEDGVSGFIIPPNEPGMLRDKLIWLADHPGAAQEMGSAARRRVISRFTWPRVVESCLEIYAS